MDSDKYVVILGCSSMGLNEMVSLLLKEDPPLSCVPAVGVILAVREVSPALLSPCPLLDSFLLN